MVIPGPTGENGKKIMSNNLKASLMVVLFIISMVGLSTVKAGNIDLETYAVHLWHEIWRRRKYDTEKSYHKDSVFEKLKRMYL